VAPGEAVQALLELLPEADFVRRYLLRALGNGAASGMAAVPASMLDEAGLVRPLGLVIVDPPFGV
jgi:hypothetical protein